ncbi:MAG: hypothetical protein ACRCY9_07560 [Phycicoccus sp.]
MTTSSGWLFLDNTVLCNFAAVDRLDLLEGHLRGRGRWTDAVAYEWQRSAPILRAAATLPWLGDAIEIDEPRIVARVDHVRRVVFGGTAGRPLQHLGEAQSCVLITEDARFSKSRWITDDHDALDYARGRSITTGQTIDLVRGLVADGELTAGTAYRLMIAMHEAGRRLTLPASEGDLNR